MAKDGFERCAQGGEHTRNESIGPKRPGSRGERQEKIDQQKRNENKRDGTKRNVQNRRGGGGGNRFGQMFESFTKNKKKQDQQKQKRRDEKNVVNTTAGPTPCAQTKEPTPMREKQQQETNGPKQTFNQEEGVNKNTHTKPLTIESSGQTQHDRTKGTQKQELGR